MREVVNISEKSQKSDKKKKQKLNIKVVILGLGTAAMALVFLPFTIVTVIGMLPTWIHIGLRGFKVYTQDITVGAMNFAGCMPFFIELSKAGRDFNNALDIILDPLSIVIIYLAAGIGYGIEWGVTGVVTGILYQKGKMRRDAITKQQEKLVEQWGEHVNGEQELDEHGFPFDSI